MPTHAIGPGTVNLCVNVRKPLHREIGRLAFLQDVSMGAFVRWVLKRAGFVTLTATTAAEEDMRALNLIRAAQRPDSPGGVNITPEEARRFMPLIAESAQKDRELAAV